MAGAYPIIGNALQFKANAAGKSLLSFCVIIKDYVTYVRVIFLHYSSVFLLKIFSTRLFRAQMKTDTFP